MMEDLTAVLNEALVYLKEVRGVSNSVAYKTMGLTPAQGKARKSGDTPTKVEELCQLAETYTDVLPILNDGGVKCKEKISAELFRQNTLEAIKAIRAQVDRLEKDLN